jgi:hypothetical protein
MLKTVEVVSWLVGSALLFWANIVSSYSYFFGGK